MTIPWRLDEGTLSWFGLRWDYETWTSDTWRIWSLERGVKPARGTTPGVRESLYPIESHDPTVEPQRQGYCVMTDPRLFACPPDKQTHGGYMSALCRLGWCKSDGPVRVWSDLGKASSVALACGGRVTTVPRWNGHVREWREVT